MTTPDPSFLAAPASTAISAGCFALTIALYFASKRLYAHRKTLFFSPLVLVPAVLVAFVALTGIPYAVYFHDTRWLMWLLGPATIAFAVPIYEYRALMKRHWFSLSVGVVVGIAVAICGSLLLSKLLHLSPELQRSLVTRSVSTPFALAVSDKIHAPRDLTALFVIATGICGMLVGEFVLALVPLRSRLARGALFGAAAHAVGTAKAREIGSEEGVVSSLTMMIAGVAMVLIAPLLTLLPI
ncbi:MULTISPECIES: LrgB family protein [Burkholderia]|uniref:Murein hydrolase effector protein LrgB n=1 Tax=Burkholderia savannae TaxID=1637837 RepID=A0ABR5T912_9BURK|nr:MULTISPECIES: LrgB family protein [Burkholderia]AOJ70515.1 murein hydrolase effector protein LrgB [Burkholderia savannae]AOJ79294.1 murein hydrolase effector protein LrgB [Burkholderia savannae]AOK45467.1 murein hydrolase effector protein LrgB [Burkholderia sp. MSMB617WGS]KGR99267.1 lrgB-like family protein [Burkholderia sp. ABCPW 111]KVG47437.1 murein hydrolase effector protein LrgB [Burkholderia sp. MSMB0265]